MARARQGDDLSGIVMKRMSGAPFGYSRRDALTWMLDVARAVQCLHGQDPMLIHRDM